MNKYFLISLLSMILAFSMTSCSLLQSMFADKVVTTMENVKEEDKEFAVPIDLELLKDKIPADVLERLKANGKEIVIVDKGSVKDSDPGKTVDLSDGESALDGVVGIGLSVANTVWPGIAALEGLSLLFSRRKRQHYGEALSKAMPVNGKVELKDAVVSIARGLGLAHSSESSKAAFEEGDPKTTKTA